MQPNSILVRYGELSLKSEPVKRRFLQRLMYNIRVGLKRREIEAKVIKRFDRVLIETKQIKKASELLKHIFGVVSSSPIHMLSLDELRSFIRKESKKLITGKTFAVRVRRVGEHPFTSLELAKELGAIVVEETKKKVRLKRPDTELFVEVRNQDVYIFTEKIKCPGGLPFGSEGKVVCLVDDKVGALAAWFMMKRGCKPVFAYIKKKLKALDSWSYGLEPKWFKIKEMKELDNLAAENDAFAIILPDTLEETSIDELKKQDSSFNTLLLRPLLTFTQKELKNKLKETFANQ